MRAARRACRPGSPRRRRRGRCRSSRSPARAGRTPTRRGRARGRRGRAPRGRAGRRAACRRSASGRRASSCGWSSCVSYIPGAVSATHAERQAGAEHRREAGEPAREVVVLAVRVGDRARRSRAVSLLRREREQLLRGAAPTGARPRWPARARDRRAWASAPSAPIASSMRRLDLAPDVRASRSRSGRAPSIEATGIRAVASAGCRRESSERPCSGLSGEPARSR